MTEAVIVAAARSPIGRAHKGSLTGMRADDLAAVVHGDGGTGVGAEREGRKAMALAWLRDGGLKGGVVADWTREELYEERLEHPWRREE